MIPSAIVAGFVLLWLLKQVVGMLISQQIRGSIPDYTARKAMAAARLLPEHLAADYEADWLAELKALDGKPISALRFAHGLARASRSISASVAERPQRSWWLLLTRALDVTSGLVFLCASAPLFFAIALISKLSRWDHPLFYRQPRLGKDGKRIFLLRFRTLVIHADGTLRVSNFGTFLRRSSLDYLPIMVNLLRGDISLVGPPLQLGDSSSGDHPRPLVVRPGLASWQLLAESGGVDLTVAEACARDAQRSFRSDIVLLVSEWVFTFKGHDLRPADHRHDEKSEDQS